MRGIVFIVLTLILAGVLALGLEWLAGFLPGQLSAAMLRVYGIGVHPLALDINLCGLLGLILSYLIIVKFVKK